MGKVCPKVNKKVVKACGDNPTKIDRRKDVPLMPYI